MKKLLITTICALFAAGSVFATKLVSVSAVDNEHILLFFKDGEVKFVDNGLGSNAFTGSVNADDNALTLFGALLSTTEAAKTGSWNIKSADDVAFGNAGIAPANVYRKSKLSCMSQEAWNTQTNDFNYDWAYEHSLFLKLPSKLQQGKSYTVDIAAGVNSDKLTFTFTYYIFTTRSEAVRINLAGYASTESIKSADLYMWMGDGGARDYTAYQGNDVFIYNTDTKISTKVGSLSFWKAKASETTNNHQMIQSAVWNADFTGFSTPGTYRLAVDGIGCSEDFTISDDAYSDPFKVSVLGFFYMRIGQDNLNMSPVPRRPLWLPGVSPANCTVYITTMHPFHPEWSSMGAGDNWDVKEPWDKYRKPGNPTNPNAFGGHSDANDWDRHLGHVSIIYDMLLPYILTDGTIDDDNADIAESGNGIPDLLDEAQNEVDFWLRLRDGQGYSHGINNPSSVNVLYQAGNTGLAAWANAVNASMLAYSFDLAGKPELMAKYRDSAAIAYAFALALPAAEQMLTNGQSVGAGKMTGKDFKLTAAAFLYNLTGDTQYENTINALSNCTSATSTIFNGNQNQLYATAAYLVTKQKVNYPTLQSNMKASLIREAKLNEANYSTQRPSRRSSDNSNGWFVTEMVTQRTIVAHAVADVPADKLLFENALILEYDWTLGRNPLNMIQMTTATTPLASMRSVENAYTTGWNDGTPGVHPGHTPYMNIYDWGGTMVMGNPSLITKYNYPAATNWPYGEMYYNTRYVYAANEFTPQQTMRGKMALYAYLHGMSPAKQIACAKPRLTGPATICGIGNATLETGLNGNNTAITWFLDGAEIAGETAPTLKITKGGVYKVDADSNSCVKSSQISIAAALSLDLGGDREICSEAQFTLDAGNANVTNVAYKWTDGSTARVLEATAKGTYGVSVSAVGCPTVSQSISIETKLLDVVSDTVCTEGSGELTVNGTGTYTWYDALTGGTQLGTGSAFHPYISANTTYYAEETDGYKASFGPAQLGTDTWASWADALSDKIKFEVFAPLTIEYLTVYRQSANNVTCRILASNLSTEVATRTMPVTGTLNRLKVDISLEPGIYYMDAFGTDGTILMDADDNTDIDYTTYFITGKIAITGTEPAWVMTNNRWMFFYNWEIATNAGCARTPVQAVLDPANPKCSTPTSQKISLQQGWNLVSLNLTPDNIAIKTVFAGAGVTEVKNMSGFWNSAQSDFLNSLTDITPGQGYLVKAAADTDITLAGLPIIVPTDPFAGSESGYQLIGCPYQYPAPLSSIFNATNCQSIKDFDGYWLPDNTMNNLSEILPGKAYFLKK